MRLIKHFLKYQQERFPLLVLIPISLSGVIGTSVVLGVHSWLTILLATCLTVTFLFHIRVIDEIRDFSHDTTFHPHRPIQKNIISIKELKILRRVSLLLFFGISLFSFNTFMIATILFVYSSLAGRDFFSANRIRKHFHIYNILNMIQLMGLQIVVYTMFNWNYHFSKIIIAHIILVFLLSALIEVVRKIKLEENETLGRDTYSHHLGYKGSIIFFSSIFTLILLPLNYIFFVTEKENGIIIPVFVCAIGLYVSVTHYFKKNQKTEKLLFLISLLYYLTVNFTLYNFLK
jgi:4-hydroxybenzoate polyprenyltransferase